MLQLSFIMLNIGVYTGHLSEDHYQMEIYSMKAVLLYPAVVLARKTSHAQHYLKENIKSRLSVYLIQV